MTSLILILKTITPLEKSTFDKLEISDGELGGNGINNNNMEHIKKSKKSKAQKLLKSQKLFKSKQLSKSKNLPKFATKEVRPGFLTLNTRTAFNYL